MSEIVSLTSLNMWIYPEISGAGCGVFWPCCCPNHKNPKFSHDTLLQIFSVAFHHLQNIVWVPLLGVLLMFELPSLIFTFRKKKKQQPKDKIDPLIKQGQASHSLWTCINDVPSSWNACPFTFVVTDLLHRPPQPPPWLFILILP